MPVLSDASVTALDICRRALMVRKVLGPNETLGDNDARDLLVSLNALLKTSSGQRWMGRQILQEVFDLTENIKSYTIGLDGDFNTNRPIRLMDGSFVKKDDIDYPLDILERQQYDRITKKNVPGVPYQIFYDPSYPLGIIYLYFSPDSSGYDLYLNSLAPLERFATLTTPVNLPPEYEEFLVYSLAKRATSFGGRMDPEDIEIATQALATVSNVNLQRDEDAYFQPGRW